MATKPIKQTDDKRRKKPKIDTSSLRQYIPRVTALANRGRTQNAPSLQPQTGGAAYKKDLANYVLPEPPGFSASENPFIRIPAKIVAGAPAAAVAVGKFPLDVGIGFGKGVNDIIDYARGVAPGTTNKFWSVTEQAPSLPEMAKGFVDMPLATAGIYNQQTGEYGLPSLDVSAQNLDADPWNWIFGGAMGLGLGAKAAKVAIPALRGMGERGAIGGEPPKESETIKGFHTKGTGQLFSQRSEGTYIALDKPFQPESGTVSNVHTNIKPKDIFDPDGLLPGTDVERSTWNMKHITGGNPETDVGFGKEMIGLTNKYIKEARGDIKKIANAPAKARRDILKKLGYKGEVGWIDGPEGGNRELVVFDKARVKNQKESFGKTKAQPPEPPITGQPKKPTMVYDEKTGGYTSTTSTPKALKPENFIEKKSKETPKVSPRDFVDTQKAVYSVSPGKEAEVFKLSLQANRGVLDIQRYRMMWRVKEARAYFNGYELTKPNKAGIRFQKRLPKELRPIAQDAYDFIDRIENGQPQPTKQLQDYADILNFEPYRQFLNDLDPVRWANLEKDWFPHIWERTKANEKRLEAYFSGGKAPASIIGPATFTKARTLKTLKEGLDYGLTPVTKNPVDMAVLKMREIDRYIFGKNVFDENVANGILKKYEFGQKIPYGWKKLDDKVARVFETETVPSKVPGAPPTKKLKMVAEYYGPPEVIKIFNNYMSPGLRGNKAYDLIRRSGNALNQAQLGASAFHATFVVIDSITSGVALALQRFSVGNIRGMAKAAVTGVRAPFRGNKIINEIRLPGSQGETTSFIVKAMEAADMRPGMDELYQSGFTDTVLRGWRKGTLKERAYSKLAIPFAAVEQAARPLMEGLVPRVKAGVFADLFEYEWRKAGMPAENTVEFRAIARKVGSSIDNRLGLMNYDNQFMNRYVRDTLHVMFRSVGWNQGTLKEVGGGYLDLGTNAVNIFRPSKKAELTPRAAYAIALPLVTAVVGSMYQYLMSGEPPDRKKYGWKDFFYPRTGEKDKNGNPVRKALPTYMKDQFAWFIHPGETLASKLHPAIGALYNIKQNQDYYRTAIRNMDYGVFDPRGFPADVAYLAKQFVPFSIMNLLESQKQGESLGKSIESFMGITNAPQYITQDAAEYKARQIKAGKIGTAPRPQEAADKAQELSRLRAIWVKPNLSADDKKQLLEGVEKAIASGNYTEQDFMDKVFVDKSADNKWKNLLSGMSTDEKYEVFKRADDEEKKMIAPLILENVANTIFDKAPNKRKEILDKLKSDPSFLKSLEGYEPK